MRHPMMSVLEQNPVLPAVKDAGRLEACLAQPAGVVFLLCGDILNIDRLIDRVHQAGKYAVVHADLVAGLAPREIAVDFLHRCGADGIISTRPMLLRRGRELGMLTVLRVFAIDSKAVSNLGRETEGGMPDVIEILPGTLCKVLRRLSRELPVPLSVVKSMAKPLAWLRPACNRRTCWRRWGLGPCASPPATRACGRCEPCRNELPCRRGLPGTGCRLRSRRPVALRR